MENIRNFSIIAHIDHGKSTLADRILQYTHVVTDKEFRNQILDTMDLERERGITIKSQTVAIPYQGQDGKEYLLNLVDTPGHVDFSYEVSRALASCEGALLLVDASQGVQAQTLANLFLAMEADLEIIAVVNKIDLPSADIATTLAEIEHDLGLDPDAAILASGKQGTGIVEILERIVAEVPPPRGNPSHPLAALIFDSHYDPYRGVIIYIRVFDGEVKAGDHIKFMFNNKIYQVEEVGYFRIKRLPRPSLSAGEVGYIIAGVKNISSARNGDTITLAENPCAEALPGFREVKPVVFSSFYPVSANSYEELSDAMERLQLNDASFIYQKDTSSALGSGFRCGFLGLLHLDIIQERLEREFNQSLVVTAPSVRYRFTLTKGEVVYIDNPVHYPDPSKIETSEELYVKAMLVLPAEYLGTVIRLCLERRGTQKNLLYLDKKRVELVYDLPLAEIMYDFYDQLKSRSRGYASFDYEITGYQRSDLVKLDILVASEPVDALGLIVHRTQTFQRGRQICARLKETIHRQLFKIAIQAAIGGKVIARETLSALRKDVTAKCYGGDITRKRKLLEKQKKGKQRMKMVGQVEIPQEAFLAVLKSGDD